MLKLFFIYILYLFFISSSYYLTCLYEQKLYLSKIVRRKTYMDIFCI